MFLVIQRRSDPVLGIHPAARQGFTGGEAELGLVEVVRILQFLAVVHAGLDRGGERIKQLLEIEHLHHSPLAFVLMQGQKHGGAPRRDGCSLGPLRATGSLGCTGLHPVRGSPEPQAPPGPVSVTVRQRMDTGADGQGLRV